MDGLKNLKLEVATGLFICVLAYFSDNNGAMVLLAACVSLYMILALVVLAAILLPENDILQITKNSETPRIVEGLSFAISTVTIGVVFVFASELLGILIAFSSVVFSISGDLYDHRHGEK